MRYLLLFLLTTNLALADTYIVPDGFGGYIVKERGANNALLNDISSGGSNPMQMIRDSRMQDTQTQNIRLQNELLRLQIQQLQQIEDAKRMGR